MISEQELSHLDLTEFLNELKKQAEQAYIKNNSGHKIISAEEASRFISEHYIGHYEDLRPIWNSVSSAIEYLGGDAYILRGLPYDYKRLKVRYIDEENAQAVRIGKKTGGCNKDYFDPIDEYIYYDSISLKNMTYQGKVLGLNREEKEVFYKDHPVRKSNVWVHESHYGYLTDSDNVGSPLRVTITDKGFLEYY